MCIRNAVVSALALGMLMFLGSSLAQAQNAPPPGGQQGGPGGQGGGERPRFDPAQMRQRMMERIKEDLEIGDKEWAVVQPKVEEVMTLSRDAGGGGMFGRGRGRGGPGGPGGGPGGAAGAPGGAPGGARPAEAGAPAQPQSDVAKAAEALRTTLENKAATPDEIKAKVQALRDAREKAKKDLAASKEGLREMLTPRQEAQLILMGLLD